jgi:dihydroxyacetone kinase-like protein
MLTDGLLAVKNRGKARLGDKTMVDALAPAACNTTAMKGHSLEEALAAAAKAAREGMETTKNMVATIGKAKSLGDRAIGHPDPGALSTYLILNLMMEYLLSGNG